MTLKSAVKSMLFGPSGSRPRLVKRGLLKGLKFNIDVASKSMRLMGLDESEIAGWTRRLSEGAAVAADVGTNDGWYALFFASRPQIERVYGFEPDAGLVRAAMENITLNSPAFAAKTAIAAKCVGDRDDENWCRLDTVLARQRGPVVMKIDVDGGEADVLRGAKATLSSLDCRIVMETHSVELEEECARLLSGLGYRIRIVKNGWYRVILPEERSIPHNRWLIATKA